MSAIHIIETCSRGLVKPHISTIVTPILFILPVKTPVIHSPSQSKQRGGDDMKVFMMFFRWNRQVQKREKEEKGYKRRALWAFLGGVSKAGVYWFS